MVKSDRLLKEHIEHLPRVPSVRGGGRAPLALAAVRFGGRPANPGHPQMPAIEALSLPRFIDEASEHLNATILLPFSTVVGVG